MSTAVISIIILVIILILFVTEVIPLPLTAMLGAVSMAVFGVISFKQTFAGFSNDSLWLVVGMLIVGQTVYECGLVDKIGGLLKKIVARGERSAIALFCTVTGGFSSVISDTTMAALMLPIAESAAATSNNKSLKALLFMPIGAVATLGGTLTLVGSVPQVLAQGFLQDAGADTFGFFTLTAVALPSFIIAVVYYATIGCRLLKKIALKMPENGITAANETLVEDASPVVEAPAEGSTRKMVITGIVFVLCVAGFISGTWTLGTVATTSALALILTRCISLKSVVTHINWAPVVILGGALGFGTGLSESGGGELIANTLIGLCGGASANPYVIFALMVILAAVMTNIMANSGTTVMLVPIAIFLAQSMGVNPLTMVAGVVFGVNLSIFTPIATVPMTLTLPAGYRFVDYIKVGLPLAITLVAYAIIATPLAYGL